MRKFEVGGTRAGGFRGRPIHREGCLVRAATAATEQRLRVGTRPSDMRPSNDASPRAGLKRYPTV